MPPPPSPPPPSSPAALQKVHHIFTWYFRYADNTSRRHMPDYRVMQDLKLLEAYDEGRVVFEYKVPLEMCNIGDVMHGGCVALVLDMTTMSSLAPLSNPNFYPFLGGISRALNITYLSSLRPHTTVHCHAHVVSAGKKMALLRGEIKSPDGKTTYAVAEHHKVNIPMMEEWAVWEPGRKEGIVKEKAVL